MLILGYALLLSLFMIYKHRKVVVLAKRMSYKYLRTLRRMWIPNLTIFEVSDEFVSGQSEFESSSELSH